MAFRKKRSAIQSSYADKRQRALYQSARAYWERQGGDDYLFRLHWPRIQGQLLNGATSKAPPAISGAKGRGIIDLYISNERIASNV